MSEAECKITVRKQKIRRSHVRARLYVTLTLTILLLLITIFAGKICPYDPYTQDMSAALQAPGAGHWMGTDMYGRDLFSRVLVGGQTSIFAALVLVAVISVFGTALGVGCGFLGGKADAVMMRICDLFLAFPGLVFALAIAALLGGGIGNAVIALALVGWPKYARIARSQTMAVKNRPYILAARLSGDTALQLIGRHILPNILGTILVTAMLDIGTMMMELAGLSFLGLGAQPPTAEWGNMMSTGRSMFQIYPWLVLAPGLAIFVTVVIFNLLGDAVRDAVNPRGFQAKRKGTP